MKYKDTFCAQENAGHADIPTQPTPSTSLRLPADLRRVALRGWHIFRIDVTGKYASDLAVTERKGQATCDLGSLQTEFAENPECNWAVATGPESGVFALELDPGYGGLAAMIAQTVLGAKSREHDWRTLTSQVDGTLSAFYRYPRGRASQDRLQLVPGVVTHGMDGYALIPPSVYSNGAAHAYFNPDFPIREAPTLLLELLLGRLPQDPGFGPPPVLQARQSTWSNRAWRPSTLQKEKSGHRRHPVFCIGAVRGKFHSSRRY